MPGRGHRAGFRAPVVYSAPVPELVIDAHHIGVPAEVAGALQERIELRIEGHHPLQASRDGELLSARGQIGERLRTLGALVQLQPEGEVLHVRSGLPTRSQPPAADSMSLADPSAVLARASRGDFSSPEQFFLAREAMELTIKPGFDQLLSLRASHGVEPYPHQLDTVGTVLRRMRGRALLCDEVGLGKTVEAGMVLMEYLLRGLVRRVLVLAPPSVVYQWQEEMAQKFNLDFVLSDSPRFREAGESAWSRFDHIIASLHQARRREHLERIQRARFDLVIVDEAHYLRNRNTRAWKLANGLNKKYILLLTATPVQNDLEELFSLITLLKPGQLKTPGEFRRRFIARGDRMRPQNVPELQRLVGQVMIRNRRSSAGITFTQRHAHTIRLDPTPPEAQLRGLVTGLVRELYPRPHTPEEAGTGGEPRRRAGPAPAGAAPDGNLNRLTLKALQMELGSSPAALVPTTELLLSGAPAGSRERALREILEAARGAVATAKQAALFRALARLEPGSKAIVFTRYRATLRWLQEQLQDWPLVTYHGGLSTQEKDQAVAEFREERRLLLSTDAGGEGRNLQFCNLLINFDLPWNPMRIEQRIGRLSRIGQQRDVHIFNLSSAGSIEDQVLEVLDRKINLFELVVGELDMILGRMEEERDIEDMVMDVVGHSRDDGEVRQGLEALGERLRGLWEEYQRVRELDDALFEEVGDDR